MNIVSGRPIIRQPALFLGKGRIIFDQEVHLGFFPSPFFFSGYLHLEARTAESVIRIGDRTYINNSCVLISDGAGIKIGRDCLIGFEVMIIDSDLHGIDDRRKPAQGPVTIGDNVFVAARAMILKGVHIGDHATIAAGAVVTRDVPARTVAAGSPARVVKELV